MALNIIPETVWYRDGYEEIVLPSGERLLVEVGERSERDYSAKPKQGDHQLAADIVHSYTGVSRGAATRYATRLLDGDLTVNREIPFYLQHAIRTAIQLPQFHFDLRRPLHQRIVVEDSAHFNPPGEYRVDTNHLDWEQLLKLPAKLIGIAVPFLHSVPATAARVSISSDSESYFLMRQSGDIVRLVFPGGKAQQLYEPTAWEELKEEVGDDPFSTGLQMITRSWTDKRNLSLRLASVVDQFSLDKSGNPERRLALVYLFDFGYYYSGISPNRGFDWDQIREFMLASADGRNGWIPVPPAMLFYHDIGLSSIAKAVVKSIEDLSPRPIWTPRSISIDYL